MLAMPLRKLPGWLANIESGKVKNLEARARVIQYQNECDDVLWQYWNEGIAVNPRAFSVQPGQTLSEEQAATLRNLLTNGVKKLPKEKQGGAMVKGWSKLKSHFKTDYRHIPVEEFHEAVNILARHVAEWEVVDDEPKLAVDSPERLNLAFAMAAEASAQVQRTVFNAVMNAGPDWKHSRYVLGLNYDRLTSQCTAPWAKAVRHDEMITTLDKLPDWIDGGDPILASDAQLANIASACMHRLTKRMQ